MSIADHPTVTTTPPVPDPVAELEAEHARRDAHFAKLDEVRARYVTAITRKSDIAGRPQFWRDAADLNHEFETAWTKFSSEPGDSAAKRAAHYRGQAEKCESYIETPRGDADTAEVTS